MSRFPPEPDIWRGPEWVRARCIEAPAPGLRPVAGTRIGASNHLDRHAASQPAPRLKLRPGKKYFIAAGDHPFRHGPAIADFSVNPEITKIIAGLAKTILRWNRHRVEGARMAFCCL
jgi:hypothetical protein